MVFQIIPSKTEKPGERSGSFVFVKKSSKEPSFDTAEYCGAAIEIKSGFTQDDTVNFSVHHLGLTCQPRDIQCQLIKLCWKYHLMPKC